jgi:hypothetical protein
MQRQEPCDFYFPEDFISGLAPINANKVITAVIARKYPTHARPYFVASVVARYGVSDAPKMPASVKANDAPV